MGDSLSRRIWKSLIGKLAFMALVFTVFFFVGDSLHIIPQSVYDAISWFATNFNTLVFLIAFCVGCWTFVKFINRNKRKDY